MKRFYLLSLFAALVAFGNVKAQGTSCETATPWTGMFMGFKTDSYPADGWYTVTAQVASMISFSGLNGGVVVDDVHLYEGCSGNEAYITGKDAAMGTLGFYMEAGVEYKLHITQRTNDMVFVMANPLDISRAPEGLYCFKPIKVENIGLFQNIKAGTTWFQMEFAYPAPLQVNVMSSESGNTTTAITSVETNHLGCGQGVNLSTELLPYRTLAKGGTNLVAVTASEPCMISFSLDAINATGCGNKPAYMKSIELDVENTYDNAYYTLDRRFLVPETGTYTFINHGAEGTVLSVGVMNEFDNNGRVDYTCDFETRPLMAVVGANNKAAVAATFNEGDLVVVRSDAYGKLEGSLPYLKVEKGTSGITSATVGGNREVVLSENPTNGNFVVKSFLLADGAEVNVYDMNARKVFGTSVAAGTTEAQVRMEGVPAGNYLLVVMGRSRSASTKLIVK